MAQAGRHRRPEPSEVPNASGEPARAADASRAEETSRAEDQSRAEGTSADASRPAGAVAGVGRPTPHTLALIAVPAAVVGIASSLLLLGVSYLAGQVQRFLWSWLPHAVGTTGSAWYWILAVLTVTGLAVGLVVRYVPGHAGPDPATLGLVEPPMAVRILPGLLLATVFALAGGVSLGPENPITATNVALACVLGARAASGVPLPVWAGLAVGGTVGALFGTPVAAALILSEFLAGGAGGTTEAGGTSEVDGAGGTAQLWDRLFGPLVAAGAGSLTALAFASPTLAINLPPYPGLRAIDLLSGTVIGVSAVALGLLLIEVFGWAHRVFGRVRAPVLRLTVAGVVLGLLGIAGGQITLFKGLDQMSVLADTVTTYTAGGLLVVVAVKMAALAVSAASGFRGGRIFPSIFIGVALGLLAGTLVPSVPMALAVATATLGFLVAVTRSGWLSLFVAAALTNDVVLFPLLCVVVLPVWLIATGRPELRAPKAALNPDAIA
jgi:H+/Cl- antiporter ClcA